MSLYLFFFLLTSFSPSLHEYSGCCFKESLKAFKDWNQNKNIYASPSFPRAGLVFRTYDQYSNGLYLYNIGTEPHVWGLGIAESIKHQTPIAADMHQDSRASIYHCSGHLNTKRPKYRLIWIPSKRVVGTHLIFHPPSHLII